MYRHYAFAAALSTRPEVLAMSYFAFLVPDGRQISLVLIVNNQKMEDDKAIPRIIEALRMRDGVIITFEDGKCAFFTAALLHAMFPDADELIRDISDQD